MPTHPLSPFETGTLANILVTHWPQMVGVGNKALEPGLVHRLDSGTSGLLVVALKQAVWERLKKDLGARKWEKTYQALIEGVFPKPMTISLPLAHDPSDDRKMKVIRSPGDKRRGRVYRAITQVRPLKRFKNSLGRDPADNRGYPSDPSPPGLPRSSGSGGYPLRSKNR